MEKSRTGGVRARVKAGLFRAAPLLHAYVILEGAPQKDVVPAADVERGHADLLVSRPGLGRQPIVICCWVSQPVKVEGCVLADQGMAGEWDFRQYGFHIRWDFAFQRLLSASDTALDLCRNDICNHPAEIMEYLGAALARATLALTILPKNLV